MAFENNNRPPDHSQQPSLDDGEEGNYRPANDSVYRTDQLIDDYPVFFRAGDAPPHTPFINDLFFGAPIKESASAAYSSVSKKVTGLFQRVSSKIPERFKKELKGVSPGGEEFTVKLDKMLKGGARPAFRQGTLKGINTNNVVLIYLSGSDPISREFEERILTKEDVIIIMVSACQLYPLE